MNSPLTSRDLLESADVSIADKPEIPPEYLPLLITSVIHFVTAKKLREALEMVGDTVSLRDVNGWLHATRRWLGLPEIGRGKPSDDYRKAVQEWFIANGRPTPEQIDAGWIPSHLRSRTEVGAPKLSVRHQEMLEEFRSQKRSIEEATDDEEIRRLLESYQVRPCESVKGDQKQDE